MRMGQWVKSSISVQQALDALRDAPPGTRADRMLKVVRHTADMGYKVGDNTSFLASRTATGNKAAHTHIYIHC
ncbi:hypothetical protein DIPPA_18079 [Diplonema papillatum]|nr:hypothetical protein DIPPA_18079 [Diplonema papillatum]